MRILSHQRRSSYRSLRPGWIIGLLLVACSDLGALTITEILYHPGNIEEAGPSLEYVELFNDSSIVVDLSGAYFSEGIRFTFPEDTYLGARAYLAVCANAEAVRERLGAERVLGDFEGRLDNGGERIQLVTRSGSPLAGVRYDDRGDWPAAADGTGFSVCMLNPFVDTGTAENWTRSVIPGGTPGAENFRPPFLESHLLVPETGPEAVWRYRRGYDESTGLMAPFSDPPDAWRAPTFDDSTWEEGQTPIGFNEAEIVTPLVDMPGRYLSFAARRAVHIDPALLEEIDFLVLSVRFDDGCVAYLNGREIGRANLDGNPGQDVAPDVPATRGREARARALEFIVPSESVLPGRNVLAVQIHNFSLESNDAAFIPSIHSRTRITPPGPPTPSVVINELITQAPTSERALELHNVLDEPLDLEGYSLCPSPTGSRCYRLPGGSRLLPRGFLALPEDQLGFALSGPTVSVFLFAPDEVEVVDAVTVENPPEPPPEPRSHARHPDGSARWWISTVPSPGEANQVEVENEVVINEIHYRPRLLDGYGRPLHGDARGDFLELHNHSDRTVPLDGLRLTAGVRYAFHSGTLIEPGGYLVVARDPVYIRTTYGLPAEQIVGPPPTATDEDLAAFGVLDNGGEEIRLEDALGNTLDEVRYHDEGDWDLLADGGGSSLELLDPRSDNSRPLAWSASDESQRAPWTEVSFEAPYTTDLVPGPMESELHIYLLSAGECLIDDVSVTTGNPPVEHIPNGDFETGTIPWRLMGTHVRSARTTEEAWSGSASLHVVATGAGDNRVNRIETDTVPTLPSGSVRVRFRARWLRGSNALHVSGHNNAFGKTVWLPVPRDTGSPGRENGIREALRRETGSDNPGPVISDVRHAPAVPDTGENVTVLATISDPDGVAAAAVRYRRDDESPFQWATLHDDGAHSDGNPGDGLFGAELPGQPAGTLVSFLVEARDSSGSQASWPRKSEEHLPLFLVDETMESPLLRYRLLVNQQNLRAPGTGLETRLLHSDELVRGTFIFEESEVYYDVGLRYHGSPWNRPPDPKMFRVRFAGDKPFQGKAKRINLSRYGIQQNEGTAYHLVEKASVPWAITPYSPRYHYFTLKLNDRSHGTVMAEIRPVDNEYVEFNWPTDTDGHAWKLSGKLAFSDSGSRQGSADWTRLTTYRTGPYPDTDSPENYRFYYNPTLRRDEDVFEPLIELLRVMDRRVTPDEEYDEEITKILNVESSLRVFAVRSLLADWDTVGIGNGQNAYLYYAPREGRHYLLPWDMDHTFERTSIPIVPPAAQHGFGRMLHRPTFRRLYAGILEELLESSWSDDHIRLWTELVGETSTPGLVRPGSNIVSFLETRRAQVRSFLRSGTNVDFQITSPDPSGVPASKITISGTAPVSVAHLSARVQWDDARDLTPIWSLPPSQPGALPTVWEATVDGLSPGENIVQIIAHERAGGLHGSRSIRVYNTSAWSPPRIDGVSPTRGSPQGGTMLTVTGADFREHFRLLVGGSEAIQPRLVSPREIQALTPPATREGPVDVEVVHLGGGRTVLPGGFVYGSGPAEEFTRGEVDASGRLDSSDIIRILRFLFREGNLPCLDAADVNDDGRINISDPITLILHLFGGYGPLPEPFPAAGQDPTPDRLDCGW